MRIEEAKRLPVGDTVEDLAVIVTTAGGIKQVDPTLPKKQANQEWTQPLGVTDMSGHIWAIAPITAGKSYIPIIKGRELLIESATIDEFTNKGGKVERRLLIIAHKTPKGTSEPPDTKEKAEGILDPIVEQVLAQYDIAATDALWPCIRTNKKTQVTTTNWIIYHRYCEQIAAKAGIVFDPPQIIVNEKIEAKGKGKDGRNVVLFVNGRMGLAGTIAHVQEWSYGEASPDNTFLPYPFAMAEKRAKDRVILKLAGFHGIVYSDAEADWNNNNGKE